MYDWIVFGHVIGGFVFVLGHGASMIVAFQIRGQRDAARIRDLLSVSQVGTGVMYGGLLILLVAGIAAGFVGDHWGRLWIWTAIGILIAVMAVMYSVASPHYGRMRAAAGAPGYEDRAARFKPPVTREDLPRLADSSRPIVLALVGGIGLASLLYLMLFKPF